MAARGLAETNGSVMSGYLYYKTKKMGLWHKYWVELHRETSTHPRVLQLFQSKSKTDNNNSISESVVLNNILELCDRQKTVSGHPMFQVVAVKMRYQFYTENKQELDHWVEVIRQELFGLPQVGIIYQFMVTVIDNLSAKKYSLVGHYTLKVGDKKIMLYSANGLISTNFSVPIEQLSRVILAPSLDKYSIYSNYVVLDITDGGVLMLMSESANDIARIVGHRKRLLSSYTNSKTTDESIPGSHLDTGKQTEMSHKAVGSNNSPKVVSRDRSISNRPPQPVPRPKILHRQVHSAVLDSSSLHAPLNNHRRHSATECDYYRKDVTDDIAKAEYLTVYSDEYNRTDDEQLYSYAYRRFQKSNSVMDEDIYYISNEDILELRSNFKPKHNRSIKGSKSMENLIS